MASPAAGRFPIVRSVLTVLAGGYLLTGAWALLSPTGWVAAYPGFGRHWLEPVDAASRHLIADAGTGFVAVGAVLGVAVAVWRAGEVRAAGVALGVHATIHFLHHLAHPRHELPGIDVVVGVYGLARQAAAGVLMLVLAARLPGDAQRRHRAPAVILEQES